MFETIRDEDVATQFEERDVASRHRSSGRLACCHFVHLIGRFFVRPGKRDAYPTEEGQRDRLARSTMQRLRIGVLIAAQHPRVRSPFGSRDGEVRDVLQYAEARSPGRVGFQGDGDGLAEVAVFECHNDGPRRFGLACFSSDFQHVTRSRAHQVKVFDLL